MVLSITLFLAYGSACLFANGMVAEFERFGLSRFRRLTGSLEVLGALGLLVGYTLPGIQLFSAIGLAMLMLLGVMARLRVRDSLRETAPATVLLLVNAYIAWYVWQTRLSVA
ncbi:DoxX family protein [Gemmatimonas sp.]|uniref:DoxX family protein n=1 Tax=Gemmatimonas sp. TaxID=1962908 RepID=UPI0039831939